MGQGAHLVAGVDLGLGAGGRGPQMLAEGGFGAAHDLTQP
jgi:hypothetical protein